MIRKREKRLKDLGLIDEKDYHIRALPAHMQLARKMRERGIRVDTGQRLEYVVTTMGGYKAKKFDKIEEPDFVKKYSMYITLDMLYYIKRLVEPLDQLLGIFVKNCKFTKEHYKSREKKIKLLNELNELFYCKIILIENN